MPSYTQNLNLIKPSFGEAQDVRQLNANADTLDTAIGKLSDLTTAEKDNLVGAINEAAQTGGGGANAPYIGENGNWYEWQNGAYVDTGTSAGGFGFTILGYYATLAALEAAVTDPSAGDAYGVGSAAPYSIYVYDGVSSEWVNNGAIQGPAGPAGQDGQDGQDGAPGAGVPVGGTTGQVLLKASAADRDTEWGNLPEKASTLTALLDADNWVYSTDHYQQTIAISGLAVSGYCYIVSAAPDSAGEYAKRGVLMQDVTVANTATFHADSEPETDITAYIAKLQEG